MEHGPVTFCKKRLLHDLWVIWIVQLLAMSSGVYGYPIADAAVIALATVADFLRSHENPTIRLVRFCLFSENDLKVYSHALNEIV